ncbi:MAG: 16S rRNA (uracil(1498)-N(3))-methyltransferase [bacterium]|nr:16S rRNA (uracil(1498)-N(3))-methyltransferase [bacterium]
MGRRRFFVDEIHHHRAELTGDQAHHLRTVLRVAAGQTYEISDNERVWLARVETATKNRVIFEVLDELKPNLPPLKLTLLVSLIKFDRMELIFEKATELGVERILPVIARRSEKGLEKAAPKRLKRWRKIVMEASQQSRRVRLPELPEPVRFKEAVGSATGHRYLLDESPDAPRLLSSLPGPDHRDPSDIAALLIGPEGGWTDDERELAVSRGWQPVSLGPQILRTETAAIAATAVLSAAWSF